jgi:4-diphosphocytidyl-2-C-methyl-D-erythritol kinase
VKGPLLRSSAPAKINLALVAGALAASGKHEVVSVLQQIDLVDTIEVRPASQLMIAGFDDDTIVRAALDALATAAAIAPSWEVTITKRVPVKAGLGGGSSDAATALRLANRTLPQPLSHAVLVEIAARLGSDVPFFLQDSPALATGDGSVIEPLELPLDLHILLVHPHGVVKESTAAVYRRFDDRRGEVGYEQRRRRLLAAVRRIRTVADLAGLPRNDLATSPLSHRLEALGAVRADVTGAGPVVYGVFADRATAAAARLAVQDAGESWLATSY